MAEKLEAMFGLALASSRLTLLHKIEYDIHDFSTYLGTFFRKGILSAGLLPDYLVCFSMQLQKQQN